jgi:hypothetical protein
MPRYSNDPRVITARFGNCSCCGRPVTGEEVLYFPKSRKVQCFVTPKCASDNENCLEAMRIEDSQPNYEERYY